MKTHPTTSTASNCLSPPLGRAALLLLFVAVVSSGCSGLPDGSGETGRGAPPALVADAEGAMAALTASPRHGEWIDVPLDGGDSVRCWIVFPERSDRAPVVIVIHEIMGLSDWIRAVADGLAAEGAIAIAPDLLSGKGPAGGGSESFAGDQVRSAIRGLDPSEVIARLDAARAYAQALPAAGTASVCMGFCWGGRTTFAYATAQPDLDGALVYYGTAPSEETLSSIACPVLGFYGGDDARVTSTVAGTTTAMQSKGKDYTPHIFAGAGHGFLRQQQARDGANLEAADKAWAESIRFLRGIR